MSEYTTLWLTRDGEFHCSAPRLGRHEDVQRAAFALLAAATALQAQRTSDHEALAVAALYRAQQLVAGFSPVEPEQPEGVETDEDWRRWLCPERGVICGVVVDRSAGLVLHLIGPSPVVNRLSAALDGGVRAFAEFVACALHTAEPQREKCNA